MASPRGKVNLACDTCRQRKSRCDGLRPICTHCRQAHRSCTYRPTPTNLESDTSVLTRLADAETRLHVLEERDRSVATPSTSSVSMPLHTPLLAQTVSATAGLQECTSAPHLHTAAACTMLHCWPRIHLNLNIPHLDPRTYLAECDQADPLLLLDSGKPTHMSVRQVRQLIDAFYSAPVLSQFPVCFADLVQHYPGLGRDAVVDGFARRVPPDTPTAGEPTIDVAGLMFPQLLVLSMAIRTGDMHTGAALASGFSPASAMAQAAACCQLALQKMWMLRGGPEDDLVPLVLAMTSHLLYFWMRPFHALGLLKSIDLPIKHMAMRQEDPLVPCYARLHFILESDILTELEGFPSPSSQLILQTTFHAPSMASGGEHMKGQPDVYVENHVQLRSILNRVLHLLYPTTKAYAQAHELADLVCSLSATLRQWYQSQPREQQFVRDATIFSMSLPPMPLRLREVAVRYFYCVFLLHRPVLYFFLHKDIEYSVRPPDKRTVHVDREPWVLESCRDCIEAAALLIYFLDMTSGGTAAGSGGSPAGRPAAVEQTYLSWCAIQMVFSAYLVLLQVRPVASLMPVFRNIGDLDLLLDRVERMLATSPVASLKVDKSLVILQHERRSFDAASPMSHMT